ncbi:hypothetical protein [Ruegeria arenilitoris]|uniref:hypothetical protein n=1 Tax=Ruegeria arenilitoris TaxID=1173585 RepID=UPI00147DA91E|nr:hypothetical protein [Ruegeria arenilitoris]
MFGFGIAELSKRRPRSFNPTEIQPLAWYDPSDGSTLFQDVDGNVPVTSNFDLVGQIRDKSGNDFHMTQPISSRRAVYREENGVSWLETDGVDDSYRVSSRLGLSANPDLTVITALRPLSLYAPIQRVFHLGGDNEGGSLGCAYGGGGYSWRFNNGNTMFNPTSAELDIVATWWRRAETRYAESKFRLNGDEIDTTSSSNGDYLPSNDDEQASLFGHGSLASDAAHLRFYGMVVLGSVKPVKLKKCEEWLQSKWPTGPLE